MKPSLRFTFFCVFFVSKSSLLDFYCSNFMTSTNVWWDWYLGCKPFTRVPSAVQVLAINGQRRETYAKQIFPSYYRQLRSAIYVDYVISPRKLAIVRVNWQCHISCLWWYFIFYRISLAGYTLQRVPEDIGTYNAMDHGADKHNQINSLKYEYTHYFIMLIYIELVYWFSILIFSWFST